MMTQTTVETAARSKISSGNDTEKVVAINRSDYDVARLEKV